MAAPQKKILRKAFFAFNGFVFLLLRTDFFVEYCKPQ